MTDARKLSPLSLPPDQADRSAASDQGTHGGVFAGGLRARSGGWAGVPLVASHRDDLPVLWHAGTLSACCERSLTVRAPSPDPWGRKGGLIRPPRVILYDAQGVDMSAWVDSLGPLLDANGILIAESPQSSTDLFDDWIVAGLPAASATEVTDVFNNLGNRTFDLPVIDPEMFVAGDVLEFVLAQTFAYFSYGAGVGFDTTPYPLTNSMAHGVAQAQAAFPRFRSRRVVVWRITWNSHDAGIVSDADINAEAQTLYSGVCGQLASYGYDALRTYADDGSGSPFQPFPSPAASDFTQIVKDFFGITD